MISGIHLMICMHRLGVWKDDLCGLVLVCVWSVRGVVAFG